MSSQPKEIIFEAEARQKLCAGMKKLADVVVCTLGPKGRNVGMEASWGSPTITNDGDRIVQSFELKDTFENMGVSIVKEAVQKIKTTCGDGTTTATLLLATMVELGLKYVAAGASPIELKRGMDKAVEAVLAQLDTMAIPVKGQASIANVAAVSASSNAEIGKVIAEAVEKVGTTGVITIEEAKGTDTIIEIVEGMQFDRGYVSPYFCTNQEKQNVEMGQPFVLLVDKKVGPIHELLPVLEAVAATGREILIIAEDYDADVISTLVVNKLRGSLRAVAVKAPGFGDHRKAMVQDIAILTGATVIAEEAGISLRDAGLTVLGQCDKVVITKDATTIVASKIDPKAITARLALIDNQIAATTSDYEKKKLQERRAKLSGGIAQIRVGAATEPELKHKKQAFEDSLHSTQAALESGIVPGGGVALLKASSAIESLKLVGDEVLGAKIVAAACRAPIRQIIDNAGCDSAVMIDAVVKAGSSFGFNAETDTVEDFVKTGIMDPVKVVKHCLLYPASAAGITLCSEVLIADAEEASSVQAPAY